MSAMKKMNYTVQPAFEQIHLIYKWKNKVQTILKLKFSWKFNMYAYKVFYLSLELGIC